MKKILIAFGFTLSLLTNLVYAAITEAEQSVKESFFKKYPKLYKGVPIKKVGDNLYASYLNKSVVYFDKNVNYMMFGNVIDSNGKNLSQDVYKVFTTEIFNSLPKKNAFTKVFGDGSVKLALFVDPHCQYCASTYKELDKLDAAKKLNATIDYYFIPLEEIHKGATKDATSILCSKTPYETYRALTDKAIFPKEINCVTSIEENHKIAKTYGIYATPTFVFENSLIHDGGLYADEIEKALIKNRR